MFRLFKSVRRFFQGHRQPPRGRPAHPSRRFVPELGVLEDRSLPSANSALASVFALDAPAVSALDTHVVAFKIDGEGPAPDGIPVFPGGTANHDSTGHATHLGKYTGTGVFTLDSIDFATLSGTFHGTFTFVAANGDKLAMNYGSAADPGTFYLTPNADGTVVAHFLATFTPDLSQSTGRFANVTGGGWVMVAQSEAFPLTVDADGYTPAFTYSWVGDGTLEFATGKSK